MAVMLSDPDTDAELKVMESDPVLDYNPSKITSQKKLAIVFTIKMH
jgi:hypothetical protein